MQLHYFGLKAVDMNVGVTTVVITYFCRCVSFMLIIIILFLVTSELDGGNDLVQFSVKTRQLIKLGIDTRQFQSKKGLVEVVLTNCHYFTQTGLVQIGRC
eukprot:TRINITY_DN24680_c0_g1_i12.p2 TRINITY_DN24680_c0_g1~~TRINITY_DN24680_c0_g1_i12.p2  ORF type:complete len:112 (+),score=6.32 TRINITY_DN24680_c0_g1_i12:37-336(+)